MVPWGIQPAKGNPKKRNAGEEASASSALECRRIVEIEEKRTQRDERKKGKTDRRKRQC